MVHNLEMNRQMFTFYLIFFLYHKFHWSSVTIFYFKKRNEYHKWKHLSYNARTWKETFNLLDSFRGHLCFCHQDYQQLTSQVQVTLKYWGALKTPLSWMHSFALNNTYIGSSGVCSLRSDNGICQSLTYLTFRELFTLHEYGFKFNRISSQKTCIYREVSKHFAVSVWVNPIRSIWGKDKGLHKISSTDTSPNLQFISDPRGQQDKSWY